MLKRSLNKTNTYLVDPAKRHAMFQMTVYTSTDSEGVKLTPSDLLAETKTVHRMTSCESAKSSRSVGDPLLGHARWKINQRSTLKRERARVEGASVTSFDGRSETAMGATPKERSNERVWKDHFRPA